MTENELVTPTARRRIELAAALTEAQFEEARKLAAAYASDGVSDIAALELAFFQAIVGNYSAHVIAAAQRS